MDYQAIIIGGGAAGFFAALAAAQHGAHVAIVERSAHFLQKVRISGGGRCNVTHHCFEPQRLAANYPRGGRELLGPFHRFGPQNTIDWFAQRGVALHSESDGRMFPVSNQSETIIDCLTREAARLKVALLNRQTVAALTYEGGGYTLTFADGCRLTADRVLLATGSGAKGYEWAKQFGHTIEEPVPSLFTFNVPTSPLLALSGVSIADAELTLSACKQRQRGPLLLTHWGFSGPAALKLSAWAARPLQRCAYRTTLTINWVPSLASTAAAAAALLRQRAVQQPRRTLLADNPFNLPKSLWQALLSLANVDLSQHYAGLTKGAETALATLLTAHAFTVEGKTTHKEEFVTCGGVALAEVSFKTMASKKSPGLYFAGEILDIDGITGGFNFQAAWTTGFLAGNALAS